MKKCSGCKYFLKMNNTYSLCDYYDVRCSEDFKCDKYKGIKYDKMKNRKLIKQNLKDIK